LIGAEAQRKEIVAEAEQQTFVVDEVTTKERKRNPVPPFITSKLQQEASRKARLCGETDDDDCAAPL
jgi:DNA topoisomerase-1